jgi:hypothetical protein
MHELTQSRRDAGCSSAPERVREWLSIDVTDDRVSFVSRSRGVPGQTVALSLGHNDLWELLHELEVERGEA